MWCGFYVYFFFSSRRRHTRSLCDWSSDVCSSDLGNQRRLVREPDELGVSVLEAGPREASLVDQRLHVGKAQVPGSSGSCLPGFRDLLELTDREVRERVDMARRVDHHLLPPEGCPPREQSGCSVALVRPGPERGELVWDDPDPPAGRVGGPAGRTDRERLGRGRTLAPLAERTAGNIVRIGRIGLAFDARSVRSRGCDHDPAP